jgi:hypothetical protein
MARQLPHESVAQQTLVPALLSAAYILYCVYYGLDVGRLHYLRTLLYVASAHGACMAVPRRPLTMAAQQLMGLMLCAVELHAETQRVTGATLPTLLTLLSSVSLVLYFMRHGLQQVFPEN